MTTGPIRRQIVLFTIPIMLSILLQQLYNMVDTIIVGNFVGENALASVGTSTPVTALFIAVATGMSTGCSIIISQMFGARQTENIKRAVSTALILNGALGLVFTAVAYAAAGFIFSVMLNLDAALLADAVIYFHIYCLGLLFQFLYNAAAAILRSVGDSKASLYFLLASSVTNIILDLVFILCFRMGVAGAALATVLSQALACVLSLVYMHRKYEFLRLSLSELRFDREMGALALKLGIPVALQQCVVSLGQLAVQRLVNTFGMTSGYTAAIRLENIVLIPVFGLNAGMATFAGQNIGARREDRVSKGLRNTLVIGLACCAVLGMVCVLFAPELVSLFGVSGFGLTVGSGYIRFCAPCYLIFCAYMITNAVLQGTGDVNFTMFNSLSGLAIRCIFAYTLAFFTPLSYTALWISVPISWAYSLVLSIVRYKGRKWLAKAVIQ